MMSSSTSILRLAKVTIGQHQDPAITIIIPYYQRMSKILCRALESIVRQTFTLRTHILVIDDASPIPAEGEVIDIVFPDHLSIQIIKRANGGPAAARNTGLDNVPKGCRYVAFLDSDDEWSTDHLTNAWNALEADCDFYFSDHYQLEQSTGAFARAGRIKCSAHPNINDTAHLHAYQGDMAAQILTGNIIGTSTVVYRIDGSPDQRFREEFRNAGEDYIFWLELCSKTRRIAFSTVCEVKYGRGVNVFSGVTWGTLEHLTRTRNELRYKRFALDNIAMPAEVKLHVRADVNRLREEYCRSLLHVLRHTKRLPLSELSTQLQLDPATISALIPALLSLMRTKPS
jgi:succinoglycan biosynthesis protein ExoW